jgi:hypothetical protein
MRTHVVALSLLVALAVAGCGPSHTEPVTPEVTAPPPPPQPVPVRPFGFQGTLPGTIDLARWQTPESCSECHDSLYSEWQGTMHANAGRDPLFLGAVQNLRDRVTEEVERTELRTCTRCHSGAGHLSAGATDSFADLSVLTSLDERGGDFCAFCHAMTDSTPSDGGYEVEPGPHAEDMGIIRGPLNDARSDGHQVAYSELHTRAAFCGTCHEQDHAFSGVPIQSTYTEWSEGPYNTGQPATTVVCQDCHMRQLPGQPATASTARPNRPGRAAPAVGDISPQRDHVPPHHVVGGNTLIPGILVDSVHGAMARERLQNAATLELVVPEHVAPGAAFTIEARVTNTGAGHNLPTGMTGIRQMWVELRVTAPLAGVTVFESGVVGDDGALDADAHQFGTRYGDATGAPVFTFTRATQVLGDHRIGPRQTSAEQYQVTAPGGGGGTLEVSARLRYRPAAPEMIQSLMPGRVDTVEITEMAQDTATITVAQ